MRKKSGALTGERLERRIEVLRDYLTAIRAAGLSKANESLATEMVVVKLHLYFEQAMLGCLVAAINNDSSTISRVTGVTFPKHISDEVCEYLIVGTGYFDFHGRSGLVKTVRNFVPEGHWLLALVKDRKYQKTLDQLTTLRNLAAHESARSKRAALGAIGQSKLKSAGSWLKVRDRADKMLNNVASIATQIKAVAPY